MKTTFVFLCVCLAGCLGALFQERPNPKADKGHCLSSSYPDLGQLKHGESKSVPNKCMRISCNKDGGVTGASCGVVGVPDGCVLEPQDLSKPYPDCCATNFKCKKN